MMIPLPVLLMLLLGLASFIILVGYTAFRSGYSKGQKKSLTPEKKPSAPAEDFPKKELQTLPLNPDFPFLPSECRFMGSPIEYLVFEGLSEGKIKGITFCALPSDFPSPLQDSLAHAIRKGRVYFQELRTDSEPKPEEKFFHEKDWFNEPHRL